MSLSIFNYDNPSLFLRDAWNQKRAFNKNFTLRAWAGQLGISSHGSFYQMVLGKRPLPRKYVKQISKSLKLGPKESLYLENLIEYSKAKSMEHKSYCKERLQDLSPVQKLSFYEIETFHFLKNPLNGAIIELTSLKDFQFDIIWIQNRLAIKATQAEIQKSIQLLLELKLLQTDTDGKLKRTQEHIFTKQDVRNEALQEYHKNILNLGADAISTQAVEKREFNATAMGIKTKDLPIIKEDIRTFMNDFIKKYEASEGTADEVYQLALQFFGLTNNKDKLQ